ncbi:MAG: DUF4124 domain-containing protein [Gammaproteobacteria bacterium]|jgi:hypothetical protein
MKLLSFTILILFSYSSVAVEFYRCIDDKGQAHFTNLPKSSLDSNCAPKDRYAMMLGQDYSNLENEFKQYEVKVDESEILEFNDIDSTIDESSDKTITQSVKDVFDPDKAFDELMSATKDRDDVFTRAMRNRSKAVESIIEEEYDGKPIK